MYKTNPSRSSSNNTSAKNAKNAGLLWLAPLLLVFAAIALALSDKGRAGGLPQASAKVVAAGKQASYHATNGAIGASKYLARKIDSGVNYLKNWRPPTHGNREKKSS